MVPEKTCAARDETSAEQGSGKTPVRERWRGQKEGSSPRRRRAEGRVGQLGDARHIFVRLCGAVIPCLNGVCVFGGAQGSG